jgi:protease I
MSKGVAVVFAEEMYECLELHYPRLRLVEAGYHVVVVGPQAGQVYKSKEGYWARSTGTVADVDPKLVEIVIVPGGFCTDRLRRFPEICEFLRQCWNDGNGATVGFICHGAWLPISAKIVSGRRGTCFFAIKDDLINAGMHYVDEKCVVDGRMVTAQTPEDLPAFMSSILSIPPRGV